MDELLIEDKKYISPKRAAKITGYAKDYIGQLCREGRVPARLVGRGWYVLETAIQDHRLGTREVVEEIKEEPVSPRRASVNAWDSPRYEAEQPETLPTIDRKEDGRESAKRETSSEEDQSASNYLQDSWREWFEHITETGETVPMTVRDEKIGEEPEVEETQEN